MIVAVAGVVAVLVGVVAGFETTEYPASLRKSFTMGWKQPSLQKQKEYRHRFQTLPRELFGAQIEEQFKTVPSEWDWRNQTPNCVHKVRNQGQCGSCWAFGTTESTEDRFCVASSARTNVSLSEQQLCSCNDFGFEGCGGGDPITALIYTSEIGLAESQCIPYTSGKDGQTGSCPRECTNKNSTAPYSQRYYNQLTSIRWHWSNEATMVDLTTHGPMIACFSVYSDFMQYKSGVYVQSPDASFEGGHCVELVGYGHDTASDKDYWLLKNSWTADWGMNGYFMFLRGVNQGGMEHEMYSAIPAVKK